MNITKIIFFTLFVLNSSLIRGQEIFINIITPNIEGESAVKGHENEIIALCYAQEAISCDISNPGTGGGTCKTTTSSFAFDLKLDKAVIGLRSPLDKGTHIARVQITFRKPDEAHFKYYKITLANVIVSELTDVTNGTSNQFQLQFSAEKYFLTSISQGSLGGSGTTVTIGWD